VTTLRCGTHAIAERVLSALWRAGYYVEYVVNGAAFDFTIHFKET
jgi:hypothetical protein